MTETQAAMTLYRDILIIMGLVFFIANQVFYFYRDVKIEIITNRVRKISKQRNNESARPSSIQSEQAFQKKLSKARVHEPRKRPKFEMPDIQFNWKMVGYILGGIFLVLALYVGITILNYDPSGGRVK